MNNGPPELKNQLTSKQNGAFEFVIRTGCPRYLHGYLDYRKIKGIFKKRL